MTNIALTYSFNNFEPVCCSMAGSVTSWPAQRFLRRQVRWSDIPNSLRIFRTFFVSHIVKGFSVVNEAEANVFLEFPCFLYDPMDILRYFIRQDCPCSQLLFNLIIQYLTPEIRQEKEIKSIKPRKRERKLYLLAGTILIYVEIQRLKKKTRKTNTWS